MADPIPLPMLPWRDCQFDAINPTDVSMMEGRLSEEQAAGTPFWKAQYTTNWMTPAFYGLFDAFVMKSSSRGASFIGYDLFRPRPIAHNKASRSPARRQGEGLSTAMLCFSRSRAAQPSSSLAFPLASNCRLVTMSSCECPSWSGHCIGSSKTRQQMPAVSLASRLCSGWTLSTLPRRPVFTSKSRPVS